MSSEGGYTFPKPGAHYDEFGTTWVVTALVKRRNEVDLRCDDDRDPFGKVVPRYKTVHVTALRVMRLVCG